MGERLGALLYVDEWEKVEGAPWPLGATWLESRRGFNFALFSRHATGVTLLLYTENAPAHAVCRYTLDPILNKTGLIWHCMLPEEKLCGATLYPTVLRDPTIPQEGSYWGYMTLNFIAPHRQYAAPDPALESRQMVKAFLPHGPSPSVHGKPRVSSCNSHRESTRSARLSTRRTGTPM